MVDGPGRPIHIGGSHACEPRQMAPIGFPRGVIQSYEGGPSTRTSMACRPPAAAEQPGPLDKASSGTRHRDARYSHFSTTPVAYTLAEPVAPHCRLVAVHYVSCPGRAAFQDPREGEYGICRIAPSSIERDRRTFTD